MKVKLKREVNRSNYHHSKLSVGPGTTALGSVNASDLSFKLTDCQHQEASHEIPHQTPNLSRS
jgi:hypothetical protein